MRWKRVHGAQLLIILLFAISPSVTEAVESPQVNATRYVSIKKLSSTYDGASHTLSITLKIKNKSKQNLIAPLILTIPVIKDGNASLGNVSGMTSDGKPYVDLPVAGGLPVTGSAEITLAFTGTSNKHLAFSRAVMASAVIRPSIEVSTPEKGRAIARRKRLIFLDRRRFGVM